MTDKQKHAGGEKDWRLNKLKGRRKRTCEIELPPLGMLSMLEKRSMVTYDVTE